MSYFDILVSEYDRSNSISVNITQDPLIILHLIVLLVNRKLTIAERLVSISYQ